MCIRDRYLPDDYLDTVKDTVAKLAKFKGNAALPTSLTDSCKWLLDDNRLVQSKRVFNGKKVSDHFAIVPTGKTPTGKIDDGAMKIFQLVTRRFLAIFFPHAEFEETKRITRIGEDAFQTNGKILVVPGYLEVYGRKAGVAGDKDELVAVTDGEDAKAESIEIKEKETRPPARYNDSTCLLYTSPSPRDRTRSRMPSSARKKKA